MPSRKNRTTWRSITRPFTFALSVAVGLSACSTFDMRTDRDPAADFSRLQTYAWTPRPEPEPWDRRLARDGTDALIIATVDEDLRAKGYRVSTSAPDFLVNYHVSAGPRENVQMMATRYNYQLGWWGQSQVYVDNYDEGTLFLDVVDAKTREMLWVGKANARLTPTASLGKRQDRVRDAVQALLKRFPSRGER